MGIGDLGIQILDKVVSTEYGINSPPCMFEWDEEEGLGGCE